MSISIYSTGSVGGDKGSTIILTDGEKHNISYTNDYLRSHGYAYVPTIAITNNGYMTLKSWEQVTPKISKDIRNHP